MDRLQASGSGTRTLVLAFGLAAAALLASGEAGAQTHVSASAEPPAVQVPHTVARYGAVFDDWVTRHEPKTAILVVRRDGKTVFAKGHNADPYKPTIVASLSKSITGACVATLIRDGKLSFTTRVWDALSRLFKRYGAPSDRRIGDVTVEELLVHRSGVGGDEHDDPIYGVMAKRALSGRGYLAAVQSVLGEYLMKLHLIRNPGSRYAYSNTGYEMLSAMIEEKTGRSYEGYCRDAVFGKLGIPEPHLDPDWRVLSGAGGWSIPGPDYLAFLDIFTPQHPFLSDKVKNWIDAAQTKWTPGNNDRWYGLGVNVWAGTGRWTVSHGGLLNARGRRPDGKVTEASVVSHAFHSPDGTGVFIAMNWSPHAQADLEELRQEIGATHQLVTVLPK